MTLSPTRGIRRHFVTVGETQFHYRRAGSGAPVVLLHSPPFSSESLEAKILDVSQAFTAIAIDAPGYGGSSPLVEAAPCMLDYARAMEACLAALGLERVLLCGEGWGGVLAAGLASHAPGRVAAVALNGAPAMDAGEQDAFLAALPDFNPDWTGAHLSRIWAWLREGANFAPFHLRSAARRILEPPPSTEILQRGVVQILSIPSQGRAAFAFARAACAFDASAALRQFSGAHLATGAEMMRTHDLVERAPDLNGMIATSSAEAWQHCKAFLSAQAAKASLPPAPAPPEARAIPGAFASRYVDVGGGQMHAWFNNDVDTTALVVQHDAASSVGTIAPILQKLIGHRRLIALDLPGSGLSDATLPAAPNVAAYAGAVGEALTEMGVDQVDFYGMWGGGFVGLDLALQRQSLIRKLVMSNAFFHEGDELNAVQTHYTPSVEPVWHGGHLMQAWHQMRDQGLFYPWFDRSADGILPREPFLATDMVHERVCSLMKAGDWYASAYQSHFVYPTLERLSRAPAPTLLASTPWDPNYHHVMEIVAKTPACDYLELDPDFTKWGLSFLPWLERA